MSSTILDETYSTGTRKEIVNALRPVFGDTFPVEQWRNKINVTWEYPRTAIHYPAIYITFTEGDIRNMGLGHYEDGYDSNLTPYRYNHWYFQGQINFNVLTLNPSDRDEISAALVQAIGPGDRIPWAKVFSDEISDADYILLQLNKNVIRPGGYQTGDVPWNNPDEQSFAASYHMDALGEFFTDPYTGGLITISAVGIFPYLQGNPPPW